MINKWNITLPVAVYLYQLNQSKPIFLESKSHDLIHGEIRFTPSHQVSLIENQAKILGNKLPESRRLIKGLSAEGLEDMDTYFEESSLIRDYSEPMKPLVVNENIFSQGNQLSYTPGNTRAWIEAQRVTPRDPNYELRRSLGFNFKGNIGLPQGGTLSPYLSILYLEEVFTHLGKPSDVEYLFYADDGIFYSDNYNSLKEWLDKICAPSRELGTLSYFNIHVNFEKSAWVKRDNVWLKSLKFLGLILIPGDSVATHRLLAATRKGSTLELSKEIDALTHLEYAQGLVFRSDGVSVINRKLLELRKLPNNGLTKVMIGYYESLLELHNSKLSPALFEFGYFLQKIVSTSIYSFTYGFLFSFFTLKIESKELLQSYLTALNSDAPIKESNFEELDVNIDKETLEDIFGSYLPMLEKILYSPKSVGQHRSASVRLLSRSAQLPLAPNSFFSTEAASHEEMLYGYMQSMMKWIEPYITSDQILTNKEIISGDDNKPHPYVFFHNILRPFRFLTQKVNKLLVDDSLQLDLIRLMYQKYRFQNLINSRYFGLIFSRLYNGSYLLEDLEQDFDFGYVRGSLAHFMHLKSNNDENLNVFTGSSYATHEMVRLLAFLGGQSKFEQDFVSLHGLSKPRAHRPFRLFAEGILPSDSWT